MTPPTPPTPPTSPAPSPTYAETRQAWRDIWTETTFERELATLQYRRSQHLIRLYQPYLDRAAPLLEAGCGPAHIVYYFRQHGYDMVGVDYAPEALRPTLAAHPDLPLHLGDIHHLPYASGQFGAYLSFGVVEHFEHGPLPALREAWRVLRPGGKLIVTVPHPNFVEALRVLVNRVFPKRADRAGRRAAYFETAYTHQQMADFVREAGFRVLRVEPYAHDFTFWGLHPIFRRQQAYYETTALAELAGAVSRYLMPWWAAFECLVVGEKPHVSHA
jgi:SAM-dependent methyltransferase